MLVGSIIQRSATGADIKCHFPRLRCSPLGKGTTGLAAVRSVFRNDKRVTVTQDQSGIVRITLGNLSTALLQTSIHSLALSAVNRYNGDVAVDAVTNSKEVEAAMRQLKLEFPVIVADTNVITPERGLAHLPRTLKNMTVEQHST